MIAVIIYSWSLRYARALIATFLMVKALSDINKRTRHLILALKSINIAESFEIKGDSELINNF